MKGMPLPFDFEGKGVLDLDLILKNKHFITDKIISTTTSPQISSSNYNFYNNKNCFFQQQTTTTTEPTSVLDSARSSSTTLSSSHGGGGGGAGSSDTAGVAAVSDPNPSPKWQQDSTTATSSAAAGVDHSNLLLGGGGAEKFAMDDWESVLSDSVAVSPTQEQSFLRWIMGDGSAAPELDFGGGFATNVDQGFAAGECFMPSLPNFPHNTATNRSDKTGLLTSSNTNHNMMLINPSSAPNNLPFEDMKPPPIFNPHLLINHHQTHLPQNPSFFFPLSHQEQQHNAFAPPLAKRHHPGDHAGFEPVGPIPKGPFTDTGQQQQDIFMGRQQQQQQQFNLQQQPIPHQLQLLPHYINQRPIGPVNPRPKLDESSHSNQAIVDQIYKAAELVQSGNPVLAQGILARLNHQLSPIGNPFQRAAFYCKEALNSLLNTNTNHTSSTNSSPFSLIFKIGAYKSFSEISPLIQFANFTCNQAILEVLDGFDRIHIVDFDIGYGGQWASLMQELGLRTGGPPSLKITALASPSTHDQLELGLTRENLIQFASEINIGFEFEAMSVDSLNSGSWSLPFHVPENEAVVVNLPIGSLAVNQSNVPFVLRFVKQLSPRIVVSVDRGCDRTDLPFANHVIHALQSYSNLLESLDAVNVNMDALQKIERFLIHPGMEKIVMGRFRSQEKTQHWRALFLSAGFSPVNFSNFTESQAECVVKRTPVRGFQVEKRQSSLVLCWQRKELVSASAWRC